MGIRVSKRIFRFILLAGFALIFFSLTFSDNETANAVNDYVSKSLPSSLAEYIGIDKVEGSAAKQEEKQRMEAEHALEEEKPLQEELTEEAKQLLASANDDPENKDAVSLGSQTNQLAKAAFVSLVRNSDTQSIMDSIKHVEDRFNNQFHYPWVFLNNEPFTQEFIDAITKAVSGDAKFGLIPEDHWSYPSWIDQEKAAASRAELAKDVIYGGVESYRHMCRFESGFFWRHPLLDDYDWYWRVEPDIKLHCDVNYDVFKWMQDNNKMYGFTISIHEYEITIKTLWNTTRNFMKEYPQHIAKNNMMNFISDDDGETYNLCHFWSNFEIASLKFWRSDAYREYFDYLDKTGGFFYERWGDAPVHSIAAALFLPREQIHYFEDIGYYHGPYNNCPLDKTIYEKGKCNCDQDNDFTFQGYSCGTKYFEVNNMKKPAGWKKFNN